MQLRTSAAIAENRLIISRDHGLNPDDSGQVVRTHVPLLPHSVI